MFLQKQSTTKKKQIDINIIGFDFKACNSKKYKVEII